MNTFEEIFLRNRDRIVKENGEVIAREIEELIVSRNIPEGEWMIAPDGTNHFRQCVSVGSGLAIEPTGEKRSSYMKWPLSLKSNPHFKFWKSFEVECDGTPESHIALLSQEEG